MARSVDLRRSVLPVPRVGIDSTAKNWFGLGIQRAVAGCFNGAGIRLAGLVILMWH